MLLRRCVQRCPDSGARQRQSSYWTGDAFPDQGSGVTEREGTGSIALNGDGRGDTVTRKCCQTGAETDRLKLKLLMSGPYAKYIKKGIDKCVILKTHHN